VNNFILVGIGGAFGSLTRYKLGKLISEKSNTQFPIGTFLINISGAVLLGILSSIKASGTLYALLGDGFLGAYTTFSTFMYEDFNLFQGNEKMNAFFYILSSLLLGIIGFTLGFKIGTLTK
jgi:CrcB protein